MSKDRTPEVGDIWETANQHIVIICKDGDMCGCAVDNSSNFIQWRHKNRFLEYKYLGKSKANINDLFKTENEEMNDRLKFRAWIGKERALIGYGARYLYFNAIGGISDSLLKKEGFDEIEQCTGLKDKNGKLIYEGDILKVTDQMIDYIVKVFWEDGMYCFSITSNGANLCFFDLSDNETTVEVIGNIHTENINDM